MKVALCHRHFGWGDLPGSDIAGSYRLLERLGMEPLVICDSSSQNGAFRISKPEEVNWTTFDLIIYHHSQFWPTGEEIIGTATCPVIFRYHRPASPRFFESYGSGYDATYGDADKQARKFAQDKRCLSLTYSDFSRKDLIEKGVNRGKVHVVPPFTRVDDLVRSRNTVDYGAHTIELLCAGPITPDKGHCHLLRAIFVLNFGSSKTVRLRIAGTTTDSTVPDYRADLARQIKQLDLQNLVDISEQCSEPELVQLYRHSHVYFCLSEEEDFNLPIIEAQAIGVPVVGSGIPGTLEAAGPGQLLSGPPRCPDDDYFYAGLIERVVMDEPLRNQVVQEGERNAVHRFALEAVENAFVNALYETLRSL